MFYFFSLTCFIHFDIFEREENHMNKKKILSLENNLRDKKCAHENNSIKLKFIVCSILLVSFVSMLNWSTILLHQQNFLDGSFFISFMISMAAFVTILNKFTFFNDNYENKPYFKRSLLGIFFSTKLEEHSKEINNKSMNGLYFLFIAMSPLILFSIIHKTMLFFYGIVIVDALFLLFIISRIATDYVKYSKNKEVINIEQIKRNHKSELQSFLVNNEFINVTEKICKNNKCEHVLDLIKEIKSDLFKSNNFDSWEEYELSELNKNRKNKNKIENI